jgi:hypothetical protein
MKAGDPVVLDDLLALPVTRETVHKTTERIMSAITELVAELRGEPAPATRFDQSSSGGQQIGNPNGRANRGPNRTHGSRKRRLG